jgi:hypothetical protein
MKNAAKKGTTKKAEDQPKAEVATAKPADAPAEDETKNLKVNERKWG